jgi:hypothetical protein
MNQYSSRSHAIFQLIITQTTLIRSKSSAMDRTVCWLAAADTVIAASQQHARVLWPSFRREFDSLPRAPPLLVCSPACPWWTWLVVSVQQRLVNSATGWRRLRCVVGRIMLHSTTVPQYPLYTLAAEKLLTFLRVCCCMHCWCLVAEHQQVLDNARASHLCPR